LYEKTENSGVAYDLWNIDGFGLSMAASGSETNLLIRCALGDILRRMPIAGYLGDPIAYTLVMTSGVSLELDFDGTHSRGPWIW
jgi:hypothetical protein